VRETEQNRDTFVAIICGRLSNSMRQDAGGSLPEEDNDPQI